MKNSYTLAIMLLVIAPACYATRTDNLPTLDNLLDKNAYMKHKAERTHRSYHKTCAYFMSHTLFYVTEDNDREAADELLCKKHARTLTYDDLVLVCPHRELVKPLRKKYAPVQVIPQAPPLPQKRPVSFNSIPQVFTYPAEKKRTLKPVHKKNFFAQLCGCTR